MKVLLIALCALPMVACSTTQLSPATIDKALAQYGDRCTSHFWGNTGFGATLGFDLNCKPTEPKPTP